MAIDRAIIDHKLKLLSKEEAENAEHFHNERIAFAWINSLVNPLLLVINLQEREKDHQHWVMDEYGLSLDEFEKIPRGYIFEDNIKVYKGTNFEPLSEEEFNEIKSDLSEIKGIYCRVNHKDEKEKIVVYNGVNVGKVGDIWTPIEKKCEI